MEIIFLIIGLIIGAIAAWLIASSKRRANGLNDIVAKLGPVENLSVADFSDKVVRFLREGRGYSLETTIPSVKAHWPIFAICIFTP